MTPAQLIANANALFGFQLELQGDLAVISLADLERFVLEREAEKADDYDHAKILEEARSWGKGHGWAYAHNKEIYEAVKAGEEVDWLDDPDMLWGGIGFWDEEDLEKLPEDLRIEAEEVAREAAQEAGEKQVATMNPDQVE
jgi:hypothetical protein